MAADSKLSKEEQIDDYEIKAQFVAGTESCKHQMLRMSVEADIARLCKMQLNALTKLKLSLPSDSVENRQYQKSVQQYSLSTKGNMVLGPHPIAGSVVSRDTLTGQQQMRDSMYRASSTTSAASTMSERSMSTTCEACRACTCTKPEHQGQQSMCPNYNGAKKLDSTRVWQ